MIPGIVTALLLVAFIGGTLWVYSPRRHGEFAAAAQLALDDGAATPPGAVSTPSDETLP